MTAMPGRLACRATAVLGVHLSVLRIASCRALVAHQLEQGWHGGERAQGILLNFRAEEKFVLSQPPLLGVRDLFKPRESHVIAKRDSQRECEKTVIKCVILGQVSERRLTCAVSNSALRRLDQHPPRSKTSGVSNAAPSRASSLRSASG